MSWTEEKYMLLANPLAKRDDVENAITQIFEEGVWKLQPSLNLGT